MPDRIKDIMPFMIGAIAAVPGAKVNINRIIEAILISAVAGGISVFGVTKVLTTKMDTLEKQISKMEAIEVVNNKDLKDDVKEVRRFIEDHIMRSQMR